MFSTSWILDWPGSAAMRRAAAAARALSGWLDPGDGGGGPFSRGPSPFLTFVKQAPTSRPPGAPRRSHEAHNRHGAWQQGPVSSPHWRGFAF